MSPKTVIFQNNTFVFNTTINMSQQIPGIGGGHGGVHHHEPLTIAGFRVEPTPLYFISKEERNVHCIVCKQQASGRAAVYGRQVGCATCICPHLALAKLAGAVDLATYGNYNGWPLPVLATWRTAAVPPALHQEPPSFGPSVTPPPVQHIQHQTNLQIGHNPDSSFDAGYEAGVSNGSNATAFSVSSVQGEFEHASNSPVDQAGPSSSTHLHSVNHGFAATASGSTLASLATAATHHITDHTDSESQDDEVEHGAVSH